MIKCPTKDELSACLLGKVPDVRAETMLDHAEECQRCGKLLDELDHASSDHVTDSLKADTDLFEVSDECVRMIDRAEIYVQGDYASDEDNATKKHLLQGTKIRDYEIIRPIGEGGMGAVFLARHSRLDRDVALKVLSLRRSGDREAQRRFEQEMTIVGKLQHPGIVRALDAGEDDGLQYLVMELINGADLRQIVDAVGPIPMTDACEIVRRAAIALAYAHEQNLIHRDVKPSNIMLQTDGSVKVMDLGLARFTDQHRSLTSTQQAMGSLDFMAPEQIRAADVDHRADVYGLACTLHFLMMGEPPEKRRTASLMVARTPKIESLRSILPPPLSKLLQHMLAADPSKRCDSLTEVATQLAPFCGRADLRQLSAKASKLVTAEGGDDADSITSDVRKVASASKLSRRALAACWVGAAALVLVAAAAAFHSLGDGKSNENELIELSTMPCISSNVSADPIWEIPLFQIHDDAVRHAVFNERTSQLVLGSDDTSMTVRDLPNQTRIIRICLFETPIAKLCLTQNDQCLCLDQEGNLAMLQLPHANVVWKRPRDGFQSQPIDMVLDADGVVLRLESGETKTCSLKNGATQTAPTETTAASFHRSISRSTIDRLRVQGEEVTLYDRLDGSEVCVAEQKLVRVVDLQMLENLRSSDDSYEHFVYAEHAKPITCLLAIPDESMVFTGDLEGEIRLWHMPRRPRSAMLFTCATNIDSPKLTYQIQRLNRWTRNDFSSSSEEVKFDNLLGEMRIETEIERNGVRHVLEYRVNPNAAE